MMRREEPVARLNAEAFASGVTGTVVHPLGDETEVDPPAVTGTVVHPPGNGTEEGPPAAGVAIPLDRAATGMSRHGRVRDLLRQHRRGRLAVAMQPFVPQVVHYQIVELREGRHPPRLSLSVAVEGPRAAAISGQARTQEVHG